MTVERIHVVAWRDLDDPTAGGSEIHINHIARAWSRRGVSVTLRAGAVAGEPAEIDRHGVRVIRRGGRLGIWARNVAASVAGRDGRFDGRIEVWHGVSFFSPLWSRIPTIGIFHHVHSDQFSQVLPPGMAQLARFLERRVYPRLYRGHRLIVLSESVKEQMIRELDWPPDDLVVVEPGVDERFVPGVRSPTPMVVVVARMMPQKHVVTAVEVLEAVRANGIDLDAVIVGDGPDRVAVERRARELGGDWIEVAGHVDDDRLVELYQRAWLVLSCSRKEGWGMTVTEGAACGTPAVATDISGHREAIVDGVTGLLRENEVELSAAVTDLLQDSVRRERMGDAARQHAARFTWDAAAARILTELESLAATRAAAS